MGNGSKSKYLGLAGLGVIAAATVAYFSTMWPPASHDNVQGAIGKREVYRDPQLTDKDVGVAGKGSVTVDDLKKLVQSQAFRSLANNPNFASLVGSGQLSQVQAGLFGNLEVQGIMQNQQFQTLIGNLDFQNLLKDSQFQAAMQQGGAQLEKLLNQYQLSGNQSVIELAHSQSFQHMVGIMNSHGGAAMYVNLFANSNLQQLTANAAFMNILAMPGLAQLCATQQVQQLASQGQLVNLANNAALQGVVLTHAAGLGAH